MKEKIKRAVLTLWVMLALLALGGGFMLFMQDKTFSGYLEWGGTCAAVCIVHLIYDFFTKDRKWDWWVFVGYFVLSVLLGPLLTVLFILHAIGYLLNRKNKGNKKGARREEPEATDKRSDDYSIFSDAMSRAIARVVANASNYPDGRYVRVARKDVESVTTKTFGIKIYGSVTYEAKHNGPERSAEEYKRDITDCMTRTQENLLNAAQAAAESVQRNYKGFDNEWEIEVRLTPEVR